MYGLSIFYTIEYVSFTLPLIDAVSDSLLRLAFVFSYSLFSIALRHENYSELERVKSSL